MMPQEVIEILTSNIDTLWVNDKGEEIGIDGSIEIIEENFNTDTSEQLDKITKKIMDTSQSRNLSDDLTLISIGK